MSRSKISLLAFFVGLLIFTLTFEAQALKISGGIPEVDENISRLIDSQVEGCSPNPETSSLLSEPLLEQIKAAILPYGYFSAEVKILNAKKVDSCKEWHIELTLGQVAAWGQISIDVKGWEFADKQLKSLSTKHGVIKGKAFVSPRYELFKADLLQTVKRAGYVQARWTQNTVKVENHVAHFIGEIEAGALHVLGEVRFDLSQVKIDESLIEAMVKIKTGVPYSGTLQNEFKQQLSRTGYFDSINIKEDVNDRHQVNWLVSATPSSRIVYEVGAGFSSDEGPFLEYQYNNYRFNRKGGQLQFKSRWSPLGEQIRAVTSEPLRRWNHLIWHQWRFDVESFDHQSRTQDTAQLGTHFLWPHSEASSWRVGLNWGKYDYAFEGSEANSNQILWPEATWKSGDADEKIRPTQGHATSASVKMSWKGLGSDSSFLQAEWKRKQIHPLGASGRWIWRVAGASTWVKEQQSLPFSFRYFAGGDDSVRGFDYQSLSPRNDAGQLKGGDHQLTFSSEWEFLWRPDWAYAFFVDGGDAFDSDFSPQFSAGLGVRWFSPVGPIRLDLAQPLDQEISQGINIHFTVGSDL